MLFGLFGKKRDDSELKEIKEEVQKSFGNVKNDINSLSVWVKHLKNGEDGTNLRIDEQEARLSSMENEIDGLKNMIALMEGRFSKRLFKKQTQTASTQTGKQGGVGGVQDAVQTAVQTAEIHNLTVMERALISILLNTDMKLSYDDLAAMLGKSRATIRGQVNSIKQKSDGLVEEIVESNGKKRVYIPEEIRLGMLKSVKVRVKMTKKNRKRGEND